MSVARGLLSGNDQGGFGSAPRPQAAKTGAVVLARALLKQLPAGGPAKEDDVRTTATGMVLGALLMLGGARGLSAQPASGGLEPPKFTPAPVPAEKVKAITASANLADPFDTQTAPSLG